MCALISRGIVEREACGWRGGGGIEPVVAGGGLKDIVKDGKACFEASCELLGPTETFEVAPLFVRSHFGRSILLD